MQMLHSGIVSLGYCARAALGYLPFMEANINNGSPDKTPMA
jgi:hypothetical protein